MSWWDHKFLGGRTGRSRHRVAMFSRKVVLEVEVRVMQTSPLSDGTPRDTGERKWRDAVFDDLIDLDVSQ